MPAVTELTPTKGRYRRAGPSRGRSPSGAGPLRKPGAPLVHAAAGCEFSEAAREDLEWRGVEFVEYDVEKDPAARERMLGITGGNRTVPVIVEEGKPVQVGWMGQGCAV